MAIPVTGHGVKYPRKIIDVCAILEVELPRCGQFRSRASQPRIPNGDTHAPACFFVSSAYAHLNYGGSGGADYGRAGVHWDRC